MRNVRFTTTIQPIYTIAPTACAVCLFLDIGATIKLRASVCADLLRPPGHPGVDLSREEIVQEARWISLEKLERKRKVEDPNLPLIFYVSCVRRQ